MPRPSNARGPLRSTAGLGALTLAILLVLAACTTASPGVANPSSGPTPTPVTTDDPTAPALTPTPSALPEGGPVVVELIVADPHVVAVKVDDQTGEVESATSGQPGDGMSVRWGDVLVQNVDPATISITWVGLPIDEVLGMTVTRDGDRVVVDVDQGLPPANSDAMGADRILILTFDGALDADDVEVTFPDFAAA